MLEILDRASMTGTNKLGLLLTLLDLAPTLDDQSPSIPLDAVAERYLEIHWEHARPYDGVTLRQSSARKQRGDGTIADDTTVMQEIQHLRESLKDHTLGDLRDKPLGVVERKVEDTGWHSEWQDELETAIKSVRASLLKNPVRRLQNLPGDPEPFLYELNSDKPGSDAASRRCAESDEVRRGSAAAGRVQVRSSSHENQSRRASAAGRRHLLPSVRSGEGHAAARNA